jgi:uncharacterized membrane protein
MKTFTQLYLTALPVFLVIDEIWLTAIAKKFYSEQIGFLMKSKPNLMAALIFYLLFIVGLVIFVISPSLEKKSLISAISLGALFGLITYATYDLTNLATVKDWPLLVTVVDLIWGAFVAAAVSAITYLIVQRG